ncbi:16825_t:CDS:1, partial [Cetraspora pellucida]
SIAYGQKIGPELQIKICYENLRPEVLENSPPSYVNLMKQCWERELNKRPSAGKLCEIFTKWQNDRKIISELSKSKNKIKSDHLQAYPKTDYRSKLIPYTSIYQGE